MGGTPDIASVGEIAERCSVPIHRAEYVIRSRGIEPVLVAGGRRLFDEPAIEQIRSELRRIESERGQA